MRAGILLSAALLSLALATTASAQAPEPDARPDGSATGDSPPQPVPEVHSPTPAAPPGLSATTDRSAHETPASPTPAGGKPAPALNQTSESICLMIESAAQASGIPVDFFARVIWRESRFRPDAVGPLTRSGQHAQGIAQFMPGTAAERRLLDPFDPVQAVPKSAEFLRQLADEFGNLGLAAAGYNAGPRRVHDWLSGRGTLPRETSAYVLAVTGRPAEDWIGGSSAPAATPRTDSATHPIRTAARPATCRQLMALLKQAPSPFLAALERHVHEGAISPWGIELSAGFSRELVLRSYAAIERKYGALLVGNEPSIFAATFRSRGNRAFYQIRIGAPTREEANRICAKLEHAGGACMVLRNPGGQSHELLTHRSAE